MLLAALPALGVLLTLATQPVQARSAVAAVSPTAAAAASCLVHSLPSFVAQGESAPGVRPEVAPANGGPATSGDAASVADVIEVECNPMLYGTGAEVTIIASQLYSRCHEITWYNPNEFGAFREASGRSISVHLDVNGNANVGLIAGPNCMVGESLITLDQNEAPYETFTTAFQVLPATPTPEGVTALPSSQVEDAESSGVVTIIEAEFHHAAEAKVRLAAGQLYDRCRHGSKLIWVRGNREVVTGAELVGEHALELDNDGNGFALALGSDSCAEGSSLIEADLEASPFTTQTTEFTVLPPQPTAEPAFEIEKRQEIAGSGGSFTTTPLSALVGQTVDYQIIVWNTSTVPQTFTEFTDARCDAGTIKGGPGASAVPPGQSTEYTCSHLLTTGGTYLNTASVTGNTIGGWPLEKTSNQVEVTTPVPAPGMAVEKLQEIAGSKAGFTTSQLSGSVGQTVDYEIIVRNTGTVPLSLSNFTDARCDSSTIAGGPGASPVPPGTSTTYTCSHLLTMAGALVNVATVTGTPPGETPITESSPPVEVKVIVNAPGFTLEKLQRIAGSGQPFSTVPILAAGGQTVEYEIIAKNTGNVALTFSSFTDTRCDTGTIAGGPGNAPVGPGTSTTFTCTHLLSAGATVVNVAQLTGTPPGEPPITMESPKVEVTTPESGTKHVEVPQIHVLPICEVSTPVLRGVGGPEGGRFVASVRSAGIQQITFYLDGRRVKVMRSAQAKNGMFKVTIDAGRLSIGVHRLSFKTKMKNAACGAVAASRAFVRPRAAVSPTFTG